MATHSSILAWKIPWTEEPGRLQSMRSQSRTRLSHFTFFLSTAESEEELKSLLKVKDDSEKACLKLNIKKTKIMASGHITS